ncbi:MAG: hypothetical protein Q4E53_13220 [Eubacteriales bacterium]|nr:hypothetical protein [Eubacteriales bacterium]
MKKKLHILKLKTTQLFSVIIFFALACGIYSYIFHTQGHDWLSNALMSISFSLMTSLVVYVLTNIRNSEENTLRSEYNDLLKVRKALFNLSMEAGYYKRQRDNNEIYDDYDAIRTVVDAFEKMLNSFFDLKNELFNELNIECEFWESIDTKDAYYYEKIAEDFTQELCDQIIEDSLNSSKKLLTYLTTPISTRKDKLKFMDKSHI